MRLVDADKIVYSWQIDADGQEHDGVTLKSIIDKIPTIDTEIIHCRECKHRPKATRADEKVFSGFSVKFPDEKCPCQCGDGWYNWYPDDDFYCGYAERREDGSD